MWGTLRASWEDTPVRSGTLVCAGCKGVRWLIWFHGDDFTAYCERCGGNKEGDEIQFRPHTISKGVYAQVSASVPEEEEGED